MVTQLETSISTIHCNSKMPGFSLAFRYWQTKCRLRRRGLLVFFVVGVLCFIATMLIPQLNMHAMFKFKRQAIASHSLSFSSRTNGSRYEILSYCLPLSSLFTDLQCNFVSATIQMSLTLEQFFFFKLRKCFLYLRTVAKPREYELRERNPRTHR